MDTLADLAYVLVCAFGWLIFPLGIGQWHKYQSRKMYPEDFK